MQECSEDNGSVLSQWHIGSVSVIAAAELVALGQLDDPDKEPHVVCRLHLVSFDKVPGSAYHSKVRYLSATLEDGKLYYRAGALQGRQVEAINADEVVEALVSQVIG